MNKNVSTVWEHRLQCFSFAVVASDFIYILTGTLQILENLVVETFLWY